MQSVRDAAMTLLQTVATANTAGEPHENTSCVMAIISTSAWVNGRRNGRAMIASTAINGVDAYTRNINEMHPTRS